MSGAPALRRELGLGGAVVVGLGSIVGTGVFVVVAMTAASVGPWVVPALLVAGLLALANGLSSAALASAHPVSGGTYEYGYRVLSPVAGYAAGVLFVLAKSASAATAAIACGAYLAHLLPGLSALVAPVGVGIVLLLTALVAAGLRRTAALNAALVATTLLALGVFVALGLRAPPSELRAAFDLEAFAGAAALLFVAFTGYGRIATLGEEVRDPTRTIPRALVLALVVAVVVYACVAVAVLRLGAAGGEAWVVGTSASPLVSLAAGQGVAWAPVVVAVGAVTATAGVVLNLLLGVSRVVLAMARRGDLPAVFAHVHAGSGSPRRAVLATGALFAALVLVGDVGLTWSFSAFCVLVYYALTNVAALRLGAASLPLRGALAWVGLAACVALAFAVDSAVWATGIGVLLVAITSRGVLRQRPVSE